MHVGRLRAATKTHERGRATGGDHYIGSNDRLAERCVVDERRRFR